MAEEDGSENPFLRLYMKQLSLSWDVLSSLLSHLSMAVKALSTPAQVQQPRGREVAEPSTDQDHKVSISEAKMAPYVTVRGAEPIPPPAPKPKETEMVDVPVAPVIGANAVFLTDADRVEKLLDIIQNTVEMPNVPCIRAAAQNELAQIEHDLWEQMYPEQAEAARKAEEERVKAAEESAKRLKAEQEKERKRQAELSEEEKEREKQAGSWVPPRDTQAHPNQERRI